MTTRGAYRGFVSRALSEQRQPRELAVVRSTAQLTGVTTVTDFTGFAIAFTVTDFPVLVEGFCPYAFSTVDQDSVTLRIADELNTIIEDGLTHIAKASGVVQLRVTERITVAGAYSRKLRVLRSTGTGTASFGSGLATTTSFLRATEIRT